MYLKKVGLVLLILLGIVVLLSVVSQLSVSYRDAAAARKLAQSNQQTDFTPDELKQDVDFFADLLKRVHPREIAVFPLGDVESRIQALRDSIDQPLRRVEFYRRLAPVVSALNDEHVALFPPEPELKGHYESGGKFFPFEVRFIGERLYVAENLSDDAGIQAGAEIVSINGISSQELRTTLIPYYSGTREAQKAFYLQTHFREALFSVYGFGDAFELNVQNPGAEAPTRFVVNGKPFRRAEPQEFSYELLAPDTLLFRYNAFHDKNGTFAAFLKEMFTFTQQQNVRRLIIDIRHNQGGAAIYGDDIFAYLTDKPYIQFERAEVTISPEARASFIANVPAFIRWFPIQYVHPLLRPLWTGKEGEIAALSFEPITPASNPLRFEGDVYLLVGPGTMSSASIFAATMQKYAIGRLVGEDAGGYATQYGNVVDAYLPHTGLHLWMPVGVNYGNSTGLIAPDDPVLQTVEDLVEHKDTVIEFARQSIQTQP